MKKPDVNKMDRKPTQLNIVDFYHYKLGRARMFKELKRKDVKRARDKVYEIEKELRVAKLDLKIIRQRKMIKSDVAYGRFRQKALEDAGKMGVPLVIKNREESYFDANDEDLFDGVQE